jgi:RNA polymerase sigma-70 factor, ECF subfamily
MKCKMQLLQHPCSTRELELKTDRCRAFVCDVSVTAFQGETETDSCELRLDDLAILRQIQNQAIAWLYDKYADFIFSTSLRILRDPAEAEDVLQQVFFHIWRSPDQLKIGRSLLPWIAVVSRNSSIDIIRRRRPSESIEGVSLASPHDTALQVEQNLLCEKARALIDELPLEQRTLLEMAYFSGMSHSEICDKTGFPLGTIKTRIRSALKNLRKDLQTKARASEM